MNKLIQETELVTYILVSVEKGLPRWSNCTDNALKDIQEINNHLKDAQKIKCICTCHNKTCCK